MKIINRLSIKNKFVLNLSSAFFVLFGFVAVYAQGSGGGQQKQYTPPSQTGIDPVQSNGSLVVSPNEDYLIGPSDVIDIKIEDAPELSGTFRLNAKGTLDLPVIGIIQAEKKTTDDVAKLITEKLKGGYLVSPIVNVSVKQSNSRAFFIQGAVRRPGIYQIEGQPSLLKLITIAGGLADNYGSTAFIMREKKQAVAASEEPAVKTTNTSAANVGSSSLSPSDKAASSALLKQSGDEAETDDANSSDEVSNSSDYELVKANINNLLRGNLDQNILIEPGDIVHIPQSDIFFVAGEVKSPGSFPLKEGTTLRQAISLAQGTTFEGNLDQSVIFREDQLTGKRQEIKVDVAAVMAGKKEDVDILPNDIIIVPNSKKKAVAKSLLKTLSGGLPRLLLGF